MCLGIVGKIVEIGTEHPDLARVDVAGVERTINVAILEGEPLAKGDWILIHAGFAMDRIDEETARQQLSALRDYTGEPEEDVGEEESG